MPPRGLAFPLIVGLVALLAACGEGDRRAPQDRAATTLDAVGHTRPRPVNAEVILATTTSTVDSGLLDVLRPLFEGQSGYRLTVLAQGSGAALKTGERGEADVLLVHAPDAERQFMDGGHGIRRELVMHNDFILVGPPRDPAGVRAARDIHDALRRIAAAGTPFISRGDNSGTHALELKLWKAADLSPSGRNWYQESGTGMGQTLQIASEKAAYTLADRATYLTLKKNLALDVLREHDGALLNVYHVIQVDPAKSPRVNAAGAAAFVEFLIAPETQRRIGEYGRERFGQPLFVPDHGKDAERLGS